MVQIGLAITIMASLLLSGCSADYKEVPLSDGRYGLSEGAWLDLRPRTLLLCTRDICEVHLLVDTPYSLQNGDIIVAGERLRLTAKVSGDKGTQVLQPAGLWGRDLVFELASGPTSDRFTSVQLKSNLPVQISSIRWVVYDPREVKR